MTKAEFWGGQQADSMNVRTWLAGMAMQGICSGVRLDRLYEHDAKARAEAMARDAIDIADALLRQLFPEESK